MSTPPVGDAVILVDGTAVGYATGARISIDIDLVKEYQLGSQEPAVLEAGNRSYRISFDKMYVDETYANMVLGGSPVTVEIHPKGTNVGLPKITVSNVILTSWELTVSQEGVLAESVEGEGKSIAFGTQ